VQAQRLAVIAYRLSQGSLIFRLPFVLNTGGADDQARRAVMGMANGIFSLISVVVQFYGATNYVGVLSRSGLTSLLLYFFVGLFAHGIGTELAAEENHGAPITSISGLNQLILRCAGFHIFMSGALITCNAIIYIVYYYYTSSSSISLGTNGYRALLMPGIIAGMVQATIGFILAFSPRIRAMLRSN
jgi:hypothetical protein